MTELHYACDIWQPTGSLGDLPKTYLWASQLTSAITLHTLNKSNYYKAHLPTPPLLGAIFTGPTGNGRHTTAEHLSKTLEKVSKCPGFTHIRLHGADLDFESPDEAMDALASIARLLKETDGLCLLLDEPQECRHSRMLQSRLLRLLDRIGRDHPGKVFHLILVTDSPDSVLSGLRRRLMLCPCLLPSLNQRRGWLSEQLRKAPRLVPTELKMADLAEKTEGFSWHQLQLLVACLRNQLYTNVRTQTEQAANDAIAKAGAISDEEKAAIRNQYVSTKARIDLLKANAHTPTELQLQSLLDALKDQHPAPQMPLPIFQYSGVPIQDGIAEEPPAPPADPESLEEQAVSEDNTFNKEEALSKQSRHKEIAHKENASLVELASLRGVTLPDLSNVGSEPPA